MLPAKHNLMKFSYAFLALLLFVLPEAVLADRDNDASTTYVPQISTTSAELIEVTRAKLIRFIFASNVLPDLMPEKLDNGRWVIPMEHGFTSVMRVDESAMPNGALVIYHTGHTGEITADRSVIDELLSAGYTVWSLDMPLIGVNRVKLDGQPFSINHPDLGYVPIKIHDHFAYLVDVTTGSPIRYFIEPVIAAVNLGVERGFQDIFMTGLSGGGWTTTLAAALDPRILASYPVAGTIPIGLRFDRWQDWGDWEQTLPELYQIASYEDLYIMAAYRRSQLQVLNEFDACCFVDPRYVIYEQAIQEVLADLGGDFRVFWSANETGHRANPAAQQAILADMRLQRFRLDCPAEVTVPTNAEAAIAIAATDAAGMVTQVEVLSVETNDLNLGMVVPSNRSHDMLRMPFLGMRNMLSPDIYLNIVSPVTHPGDVLRSLLRMDNLLVPDIYYVQLGFQSRLDRDTGAYIERSCLIRVNVVGPSYTTFLPLITMN